MFLVPTRRSGNERISPRSSAIQRTNSLHCLHSLWIFIYFTSSNFLVRWKSPAVNFAKYIPLGRFSAFQLISWLPADFQPSTNRALIDRSALFSVQNRQRTGNQSLVIYPLPVIWLSVHVDWYDSPFSLPVDPPKPLHQRLQRRRIGVYGIQVDIQADLDCLSGHQHNGSALFAGRTGGWDFGLG